MDPVRSLLEWFYSLLALAADVPVLRPQDSIGTLHITGETPMSLDTPWREWLKPSTPLRSGLTVVVLSVLLMLAVAAVGMARHAG